MSSLIKINQLVFLFTTIILSLSLLLSNSLIWASDAECKEDLPKAQVDESWFLTTSTSIPDAWFVAMMDPVTDSDVFNMVSNSKSMSSENGSNNLCITVYTKSENGESVMGVVIDKVGIECTYNNINLQYCEVSGEGSIFSVLPKNVKIEIVKTNNQDYVALVACAAGVVQKWIVLTPTQEPLPNGTIYEIMSYFEEIGVTNSTESSGHYAERISFGGKCTDNAGLLGALSSIFG